MAGPHEENNVHDSNGVTRDGIEAAQSLFHGQSVTEEGPFTRTGDHHMCMNQAHQVSKVGPPQWARILQSSGCGDEWTGHNEAN